MKAPAPAAAQSLKPHKTHSRRQNTHSNHSTPNTETRHVLGSGAALPPLPPLRLRRFFASARRVEFIAACSMRVSASSTFGGLGVSAAAVPEPSTRTLAPADMDRGTPCSGSCITLMERGDVRTPSVSAATATATDTATATGHMQSETELASVRGFD
jgi:hypothetical protein